MAKECPPMAVTQEQFDARIKAGARTMEEIDPELMAWCRRSDRYLFIGWCAVSGFCAVVIFTTLLMLFK